VYIASINVADGCFCEGLERIEQFDLYVVLSGTISTYKHCGSTAGSNLQIQVKLCSILGTFLCTLHVFAQICVLVSRYPFLLTSNSIKCAYMYFSRKSGKFHMKLPYITSVISNRYSNSGDHCRSLMLVGQRSIMWKLGVGDFYFTGMEMNRRNALLTMMDANDTAEEDMEAPKRSEETIMYGIL
jgi:hypothetical protein